MSNFKRMVRERMAKTGESWQTAARHVRKKAELRKTLQEVEMAYPLDIKTMIPDRSTNLGTVQPSVSCGACGMVFESKGEMDARHNTRACWDKVPCQGCGEVHGYDYDYDYAAHQRICKGCGHRRDTV